MSKMSRVYITCRQLLSQGLFLERRKSVKLWVSWYKYRRKNCMEEDYNHAFMMGIATPLWPPPSGMYR
jgi:hypothetical protein